MPTVDFAKATGNVLMIKVH